jgi:heme-degrading monooxygenase HmoA
MIERHWKGITSIENSNSYIKHLLEDTFPQLSKIKGFKKASILKRVINDSVEFLIITQWESINSIMKFSGENTEVAVVPLKAQKLMTSYDLKVSHYEKIEA